MYRRLYRSRKNNVISGVCGGIADYFSIDPVLVRILWVFGTIITSGTGVIIYVISAIIMPEYKEQDHTQNTWANTEPGFTPTEDPAHEWKQPAKFDSAKSKFVIGAALIILGSLMFLKMIIPGFHFNFFWPVAIICIGVAFLYKGKRRDS